MIRISLRVNQGPLTEEVDIKTRGHGREKLLVAARDEFEEHGFGGTNSNAIAKRAGFAPQTFYRHFKTKKAIFLAVYEDWVASGSSDVMTADSVEDIVDALIHRHKAHRIFRRSLRALTASDPDVAAARARARVSQLAEIRERVDTVDDVELLVQMFIIERLSDAISDGEFTSCGFSEASARRELIKVVGSLLHE